MKQAAWILALALLGRTAAARHHHRNSKSESGVFDYYLLSLSSQNESGWPEHCGPGGDVPERVAADMSDVMPARKLVFHEWSTHGTCSGLEPAEYFALVRRGFNSIAIPAPLQGPGSALEQTPGAIVAAFRRSNPRLTADSVVVSCSGQERACSPGALREGCRAQANELPARDANQIPALR